MEVFVLLVLALLIAATWGVYRIAVVTKEAPREPANQRDEHGHAARGRHEVLDGSSTPLSNLFEMLAILGSA